MTVTAIIPARGGSKGIPRKNLAMCAGKPLVDWVIKAANDSELIDVAILSSDDAGILERAWGKVLAQERPAELAGDDTPTEAAMEYALRDDDSDIVVLLQPTSPMTEGWQIDEAIRFMGQAKCDSALSVVESHSFLWHPNLAPYDPSKRPMRQDHTAGDENGAIYVTRIEQWRDSKCRIGGVIGLYVMPEEHRYQVDSPLDLETVSMLLEKREAKNAAYIG